MVPLVLALARVMVLAVEQLAVRHLMMGHEQGLKGRLQEPRSLGPEGAPRRVQRLGQATGAGCQFQAEVHLALAQE